LLSTCPLPEKARYLRTRPTAIALKPPLGFIGEETKSPCMCPRRNHSLEGVQRAFDAILDNIDEHLKRSAESLSAWPMNFRGMVINAIDQRINQLKSTAQISAGLTFKPKATAETLLDLTVLPVRKQIRPEPFNFQLPAEQQFYLCRGKSTSTSSPFMQNMSLVMEYSPKSLRGNLGEEALRFHFPGTAQRAVRGKKQPARPSMARESRTSSSGKAVPTSSSPKCKIWEGVGTRLHRRHRPAPAIRGPGEDTKTALVIFNRNKGF